MDEPTRMQLIYALGALLCTIGLVALGALPLLGYPMKWGALILVTGLLMQYLSIMRLNHEE